MSRSIPTASSFRSRQETALRTEHRCPTEAAQSTQPKAVKLSPRERLLQAASELFYAEGIQSVGIDRVIERAGVAKASLYSAFGSKEQLVGAYLDARHAQVFGRLRAAVDAPARAAAAALIADAITPHSK